jgi:hypothetical protein
VHEAAATIGVDAVFNKTTELDKFFDRRFQTLTSGPEKPTSAITSPSPKF